jgi:hypothetical protein
LDLLVQLFDEFSVSMDVVQNGSLLNLQFENLFGSKILVQFFFLSNDLILKGLLLQDLFLILDHFLVDLVFLRLEVVQLRFQLTLLVLYGFLVSFEFELFSENGQSLWLMSFLDHYKFQAIFQKFKFFKNLKMA